MKFYKGQNTRMESVWADMPGVEKTGEMQADGLWKAENSAQTLQYVLSSMLSICLLKG